MAALLDEMRKTGDFVELESSDEYARYFNHLTRVFRFLIQWYQNLINGGATEERRVTGFLARMLFTVNMLRLKHFYSPTHQLHLDLNDSGFPHTLTIMDLETDLRAKNERLQTLSPRNMLIELMLTEMLEKKQEPTDLLRQMAETEYFSSLDENRLVLAFTPGELELKATQPDHRKYMYSWACYDFESSMLYVHVFAFDQDIRDEPLEKRGAAFNRFLEVIKGEGSRVPTVGVLASSIDEALDAIHPKILKRVRIGPIICPRYSQEADPEPMLGFLKRAGTESDFALKMSSEFIISDRQVEQPRRILGLGRAKRVREHFVIPDSQDDLRCHDRHASEIHDYMILPHHVLQEVVNDPDFAPYQSMQLITYTKEGEVYAV